MLQRHQLRLRGTRTVRRDSWIARTARITLLLLLANVSAPALANAFPASVATSQIGVNGAGVMCIGPTGTPGKWDLYVRQANGNLQYLGVVTEMSRAALPAPPSDFNGTGFPALMKFTIELKKSNGQRIYGVAGAVGYVPEFGGMRSLVPDHGATSRIYLHQRIVQAYNAYNSLADIASSSNSDEAVTLGSSDPHQFCMCQERCRDDYYECVNDAFDGRTICYAGVIAGGLACVIGCPTPICKAGCVLAVLAGLKGCRDEYEDDINACEDEVDSCLRGCVS